MNECLQASSVSMHVHVSVGIPKDLGGVQICCTLLPDTQQREKPSPQLWDPSDQNRLAVQKVVHVFTIKPTRVGIVLHLRSVKKPSSCTHFPNKPTIILNIFHKLYHTRHFGTFSEFIIVSRRTLFTTKDIPF